MNKIYNENEAQKSKLIKDLKELPKIKVPENFEFNLMARIQNKNFGEQRETRFQFNLIKFLAPSAAVVTIIILFFIFLPSANQNNNPNQISNRNMIADNAASAAKDINDKKNNPNEQNLSSKISAPSNNAIPNQSSPSRFFSPRSVKVDDYISNENANQRNLVRGNVVSSGNEQSEYDGFFKVEKPDKKTLEKYRARVDSIRKAQQKADSLNKVQKMP